MSSSSSTSASASQASLDLSGDENFLPQSAPVGGFNIWLIAGAALVIGGLVAWLVFRRK